MLAAALQEEVNAFLGRDRYERDEGFRRYRNGYHRGMELTVGVSAVEVKAPRVSDVPAEVSGAGFESKIVRRYVRTSHQTQDLFRKLYVEGLSTGDFEPVYGRGFCFTYRQWLQEFRGCPPLSIVASVPECELNLRLVVARSQQIVAQYHRLAG